ncbi:hypothetical protein LTS08_002161 [Lithohypha guttulata]|nr:hypothetical protein LTS08_002161 [Lithohypha guttulata]
MSSISSTTIAPTSAAATTSLPPTTTAATTTTAVTTTTPLNSPASTTTLPPSTSITSVAPVTTVVPNPSTLPPTTIVTQVTSVITESPAASNQGQGPVITTVYSTQPIVTITPTASQASTLSTTSTRSSTTQSALSAPGSSSDSGGLSNGATIAIAVIIPIVAVIALIIFGLWFWRRRKAKKDAEELRKNEMAEYGFNPNNDPTLPVAAAAYTDGASEGNDDSGYRGWGATTASNRKPSTTLGSNSRAGALAGLNGTALSDYGSQGYGSGVQPSPSAETGSDGTQDPLVHGYPEAATAGAVGAAAFAAGSRNNRYSQASAPSGIHRGPSNASSAYSGVVAHSEADSDVPEMPTQRPYYQEEVPYNIYNDVQPGHGPYGDATYSGQGDQPVIRDVQARRNTRIERAPTFPQQGGIAQNF